MATFICRETSEEIWRVIQAFTQRKAMTLRRTATKSGDFQLNSVKDPVAGTIRSWTIFKLRTSPDFNRPEQNRLQITASLTKGTLRCYIALGLGAMICFFTGLRIAMTYLQTAASLSAAGLLMAGLSVVLLLILLRIQIVCHRSSSAVIREIVRDLGSVMKVQQTLPGEFTGFTRKGIALLFFNSFFAIVLYGVGKYVGVIPLLIGLVLVSPELCHNLLIVPASDWRGALSTIHIKWSSLHLLPVGVALLLVISTAAQYVGPQDPTFLKKGNPVVSIQNATVGLVHQVAGDTRTPEEIARDIWHSVVEYAEKRQTQNAGSAPLTLRHFTAALLFLFSFLSIFLLAFYVRGVLAALHGWNVDTGGDRRNASFRPSAIDLTDHSGWPKLGIVLVGFTSGVLHWCGTLIAIDMIWFLLTGDVVFLKVVGVAAALHGHNFDVVTSPIIGRLVFVAVFTSLSLPGILTILLLVTRVLRVAKRWNRPLKWSQEILVDEAIEQFIRHVCNQLGYSIPRLITIDTPSPKIYSYRNFFDSAGTIVVSKGLSKNIEGVELQALVAHEIYHLHHDAKRVFLYRGLSILLLCPFDYFLLLYDFGESEYAADEFAVRVIGGSEPLKESLIKLSVLGVISTNDAGRKKERGKDASTMSSNRRNATMSAIALLLDKSLFGAAYPSLSDRLNRIC